MTDHPPTEPHLPDVSGSDAPEIVLELPSDPPVPHIDREAQTLPPGHADLVEWEDPLTQDPMAHAPLWGKYLHENFQELRGLVLNAMDPEGGIPSLRTGLLSDLSAWLKPHIDEFMRVVAVQEKALAHLGEEHDELKAEVIDLRRENIELRRRVEELERWRAATKDRAT
ncbi:MAG: hypothetical protein EPO32_14880 [Anaerolineae bacterium]|nr:MAG: hypothetical protein EPO32_14880 [Anaerolineae bacterium]